MMNIKHHQDTHCHKQQSCSEQGIYLSDDFIDRKQSGKNIIDEHYNDPESSVETVGSQLRQQSCRSCHKDRTYQNHQDNGKTPHHLLGSHPQKTADNFRQALTTVTQREHSGEIIVCGTGKDTSQHNPQIGSSTELRSHNSSEDGAETGYV